MSSAFRARHHLQHRFVVVGALVALFLLSVADPARAAPALPSPAGWPLVGSTTVIRGFDPPETRYARGHRGVDLASSIGAPVLAAAAGRVTFAGMLAGRGVVVVDHGAVRTTYEPVSAAVPVGARVALGDLIGRVSTGSHCGATPCLHWGLRRGDSYLDPLSLAGAPATVGPVEVRLLPASAGAVVRRRAAQRAALAAAQQTFTALSPGPAVSGRHGFLHPVAGPVTSRFGRRFHPVLKVWKLHDGTDFGAACGTPIRAADGGVVTHAYANPAYVRRLFLDHGRVGGRRVVTSYNHASRYVVAAGDRVTRGQVIGYVGDTGYATGCHLHLMVWLDGRLTDPLSWL